MPQDDVGATLVFAIPGHKNWTPVLIGFQKEDFSIGWLAVDHL